MEPHRIARNDADGLVATARVLVLLQGALLVLSTVESVFWAILGGLAATLAPTVALTAVSAAVTLALAGALGARRRRARRLVLVGECGVLLFALADLGLALALTHRPLDVVPLVTRIAVPLAVIWLLRRPPVRAAFSRPARALEVGA